MISNLLLHRLCGESLEIVLLWVLALIYENSPSAGQVARAQDALVIPIYRAAMLRAKS